MKLLSLQHRCENVNKTAQILFYFKIIFEGLLFKLSQAICQADQENKVATNFSLPVFNYSFCLIIYNDS